ncbi:MAG: hypothetical protein A2622_11015 [Bdellovibrionales bacterium RIFCSPHIGHO2_01_FULL_40_29]|nr:MAG: hypothetical protein A2622_11015 [Bdellovibrionales bacterium RIFCSPHIGHO2_01_FULL_40_29]OFZ34484.1 MAG: hypothetical protein A3D17_01280 [Bdellovibrionales bacterium RIFCSPHIGHO2_02_FULL_40_15]
MKKSFTLFYATLCFLFVAVFFHKSFLREYYTGWDSFDAYAVNFVYFSDALKSGTFPLWNHFVLSGTPTFPNLFTATLFSPIDIFFLLLSLFIHPIYAVELSLLFGVFIGSFGFFLIFHSESSKNSETGNFFYFAMSTCYAAVMFPQIMGQIAFIYSFAVLPWFFVFVNTLLKDPNYSLRNSFIFGVLVSFVFAKGYFYLNVISCLCFASWVVLILFQRRKECQKTIMQVTFFLLPILFLYLVLFFEASLDLAAIYSGLRGDLVVPEPRIRQLASGIHYYYSNFKETFTLFVWKDLIKNITWLTGIIHLFPLLVLSVVFVRIKSLRRPLFLLGIMLLFFGIFSSYENPFSQFVNKYVPILKSNRWSFINLYFSEAGAFLIITELLKSQFAFAKNKFSKAIKYFACLLIIFGNFYVMRYYINYGNSGDPNQKFGFLNTKIATTYISLEEKSNFSKRTQNISITKNIRTLGLAHDFKFDDISWLTTKVPFSHGYLNSVHFLYWYMKDADFLKKIARFDTDYRIESVHDIKMFASDNDFVKNQLAEVDFTGSKYILTNKSLPFPSRKVGGSFAIDHILVNPNEALFKVTNDSQGVFTFLNQWNKNWTVTVNDERADLIKVNLLFTGVVLNPGENKIVFQYRWPISLMLLVCYYIGLLFFVLFCLHTCCKRLLLNRYIES